MSLFDSVEYITEIITESDRNDVSWDRLNGKQIMITGASGMIGGYLIDVLMARNERENSGIKVYALSRNASKLRNRFLKYRNNSLLTIIEHDVENSLVENCKIKEMFPKQLDFIIHAASNTHPKEYSNDPVGTITTNILGTYNLAEYVRRMKTKCRIVVLSSVEIYGDNRCKIDENFIVNNEGNISVYIDNEEAYFTENNLGYINCNTVRAGYPESKRLSESLMQSYISQYGLDAVIVRLSRIYGASLEKDDSKALTQFIRKAVNGEDIVLKSKGNQLYSYTYIADAVRAILIVMINANTGEVYNVASKHSDARLKDIARYLAEKSNTKVIFDIPNDEESKGYSPAIVALLNADKISRELGYKAYYNIEEGLVRVLGELHENND